MFVARMSSLPLTADFVATRSIFRSGSLSPFLRHHEVLPLSNELRTRTQRSNHSRKIRDYYSRCEGLFSGSFTPFGELATMKLAKVAANDSTGSDFGSGVHANYPVWEFEVGELPICAFPEGGAAG